MSAGPIHPNVIQDPVRWAFIEDFSAAYLLRHPERTRAYARRQARLRWRQRRGGKS